MTLALGLAPAATAALPDLAALAARASACLAREAAVLAPAPPAVRSRGAAAGLTARDVGGLGRNGAPPALVAVIGKASPGLNAGAALLASASLLSGPPVGTGVARTGSGGGGGKTARPARRGGSVPAGRTRPRLAANVEGLNPSRRGGPRGAEETGARDGTLG